MVLEGNIVDINNCFGEVLINEKIYKFNKYLDLT